MWASKLDSEGLFGGLTKELKVDLEGLIKEINTKWKCGLVLHVIDQRAWHRGGAETYVAFGKLILEDGSELDVVGKAFVGWGVPPQQQQKSWEDRRRMLISAGVAAPIAYMEYPAMTIEQFIPDELPKADSIPIFLAFQLGQIARELYDRKHYPINLLGDVRVNNGCVVLVDFGADLGGEAAADLSWVNKIVSSLTAQAAEGFNAGFRDGLKATLKAAKH